MADWTLSDKLRAPEQRRGKKQPKTLAESRMPGVDKRVMTTGRKPEKSKPKKPGFWDYSGSIGSVAQSLTPTGLLQASGEQAGRLGGALGRYAVRTTPGQFAEDVRMVADVAPEVIKAIPGAIWEEASNDPLGFAASLLPGSDAYGAVQRGAQLRSEGDYQGARNAEQGAALLEALNFLPIGAGAKAGKKATKGVVKAAEAVRPVYEVAERGPTLRVARVGAQPKIVPEARGATLPQLRELLSKPEYNQPAEIANEYTLRELGRAYDVGAPDPVTSLQKQSGIARAFREAADENPEYKRVLFERYGQVMPDVVEQAGAQNYDQLTEAAYRQLSDEVTRQFDTIPVSMTYHGGDLEYATPSAMLRDVLGEGNLNVFRGGDPHPYLSDIDPATGLTGNEMFRAAHDYFGHGIKGTTFRPGGEEAAYASHHQMLSPLAQMALLSETRGQNSLVNYSPLNIDLLEARMPILAQIKELERFDRMRGTPGASAQQIARLNARLGEIGAETNFAPQTPVLLPPEFLDPATAGGMPEYLRGVIRPAAPTGPERAVHLSRVEGLTATDPAFYGTGHRGDDWKIRGAKGSPRQHTSFYIGPEGTVAPESVVADIAPFPYETTLQGLYDIQSDPEALVRLARVYNQEGTAIPDFARMVREYGYGGYRNADFLPGQAAANVFDPVEGLRPIKRGPRGYAEGGEV